VFVIGLWLRPGDSAAHEPERELMVINGKSWPHSERLTYTVGDTVRWRWINPSSSSHPMHLHGFYYEVDSRGSWAEDTIYRPPDRRQVLTELLVPGGTMAARWTPVRPGNWLFHCHFAFHLSNEQYLSPRPAASGSGAAKIEVVLHGEKLRGGFTLIRTERRSADRGQKDRWLLVKRRDEYADESWNIESPELARSVLTGRTLREIEDGRTGRQR
jgi:hypothetical protein